MSRIKVLIVEDHALVRMCLTQTLEQTPGIEVVGQAVDGREAIRLSRQLHPDVVVMDVMMPELNGIESTRQILQDGGNGNGHGNGRTRVIALTSNCTTGSVREMLNAGAHGFVLKHSALEDLVQAIREVAEGRTWLSPDVAGIVVADYQEKFRGDNGQPVELTRREREVLQLVAEGHASKQIASQLHLSVKTVEFHRQRLMKKLNLFSVAHLTKYAVREGITTLDG